MISLQDAIHIHEVLIEKYGGTKGIRNLKSLESALKRPFQTFNQEELYQSPLEKAASLLESLISNHPFIDGNKRTGYVLMRLLLMDYKLDLYASEIVKYNFVIGVAKGEIKFDDIVTWLKSHTK